MGVGVNVIGIITMCQAGLLFWQISSVTDDGSSNGQNAKPQFYHIAYFIIIPFVYSAYTFIRYWKCRTINY